MPVHLSADAFQELVDHEFDALPPDMLEGLENVAFMVEDRAPGGEVLLGRYEGVDLPDRGQYGFGELPDRVVIFRLAHLAAADSIDGLRAEVRTTLVHEIGHFYGLDDERLHELGWA